MILFYFFAVTSLFRQKGFFFFLKMQMNSIRSKHQQRFSF